MRGSVLGYNAATGEGMLSGSDGQRYPFAGTDWRGDLVAVQGGAEVDFAIGDGSRACDIYPVAAPPALVATVGTRAGGPVVYPKSNVAAGLLALFLGPWGIHKFYLGYGGAGATMLIVTLVSIPLSLIGIGLLGLMAMGVIALVEAIIYLTKSPEDFNYTYVEHQKPWF